MSEGARVLVVDDEPNLRRALTISLQARGYRVEVAADGTSALQAAAQHVPDLMILDLGLPDLDGSEVLARLRAWTALPVLVLSARVGSPDKIRALDAGADDYVTKPFDMAELLARLRALSRRVDTDQPARLSVGPLLVDLASHSIHRSDGSAVHLTRTEWQVLEILAANPGRLLSNDTVLRALGRDPAYTDDSYLRLYIGQLRRKLEADPARPRHLITETGLGHRFLPSA